MKVLVFAEQRDGKLKSSAYEALNLAYQLSASNAANVAAVIVGDQVSGLTSSLSGSGCDTVYLAENGDLKNYNNLAYLDALQAAIETFKPELVLAVASPMGRDLLPRLAVRNNGGIATDVIELSAQGGKLSAVKPMYSGKVLANLELSGAAINFVSIRANVFSAKKPEAGAAAANALVIASLGKPSLVTKEIRKGSSARADLTEATNIISGGRALGSAENFKVLADCADVLGATVGASRAAVDAGYATHDMQVGQTGKTVNPNLYIACGISGSIQHMAGMRTSKIIVAINTDPDAPIFNIADYGIVADLFTAVPILTEKLKGIL